MPTLLTFITTTIITLLTLTPTAALALMPIEYPTCPENLHLILVTSTTTTPSSSAPLDDPLINATLVQLPSSNLTTITVPYYDPSSSFSSATEQGDYFSVVDAAIRALRARIDAAVTACGAGGGGAGIALVGYGRPGAQVVGDALCGRRRTDGEGDPDSDLGAVAPLGRALGEKITAVILIADPGRVASQAAWNVGTATRNGIYPYRDLEQCRRYNGRVRSYCDSGDVVCDGGKSVAVHQGTAEKYRQDAIQFLVERASQVQPS